jgi:cell division protein FtsI/penicillin-binding protein 2
VVKRVVSSDGRVLEESPKGADVVQTVDIDPSILEKIKKSMVGVVDDPRGTGHKAALPETSGVVVGGKTGTAQVGSREGGVREEDHAWFAGYAPADNPQIVVVALVENGGHGGVAAAPIARDMLMSFFGIPEPEPQAKGAKVKRAREVVSDND